MGKCCMKSCLRIAVGLIVAMGASGCVEREYSLENIAGGGNITVGDVVTTPPVTARLTFGGLLGGTDEVERILEENGFSLEDIGLVEMYIGEELFRANLPLDIPLVPEGVLDTFLPEEDDRVELLLHVASTLPLALKMRLELTDAFGGVVAAFDDIPLAKAAEGEVYATQVRLDVTETIGRLSEIEGLNVSLLRPDLEKVKFRLDSYVEISVRLEKTGGIRFPLT